jgi:hypothetical protein
MERETMDKGEMQYTERDATTAAIFACFLSPYNRKTLAELTGMIDTKADRDRAYLDDVRRG